MSFLLPNSVKALNANKATQKVSYIYCIKNNNNNNATAMRKKTTLNFLLSEKL